MGLRAHRLPGTEWSKQPVLCGSSPWHPASGRVLPTIAANAFLALDSYIYGFERQWSSLSLGAAADTTEAAQEVLAAIPQGAYPSLAAVATDYAANPYGDASVFYFGLELILDGLQRLLE